MRHAKLKFLAAAGGFMLAASLAPAQAADVYEGGSLKDEPVYSTPYIGWTGFYIGGNLGGAWDNTDDFELFDDTVLTGGFHAGYNWELSSRFVLGLEGDIAFMDDIDYLSTIRARLGYSTGPALVYVTGGAAFIGFDDDVFGDESETGWVLGGGIDYKLRDNWSLGGEALYYSFDDPVGGLEDPDFWVARARLTYHIGSWR